LAPAYPSGETMPAKTTGTVEQKRNRWYARLTIEPGKRERVALPTCATREAAEARKDLLMGLLAKLRAGNADLDLVKQILERAGTRDGRALDAVISAAESVAAGRTTKKKAPGPKGDTFESVGKRWTSGELAAEYPDHVKAKKTSERDRQRLER